jgi:hypothetical protein
MSVAVMTRANDTLLPTRAGLGSGGVIVIEAEGAALTGDIGILRAKARKIITIHLHVFIAIPSIGVTHAPTLRQDHSICPSLKSREGQMIHRR